MRKVLVTGGAGFIGSNLVKKYLESGYQVVVVDNLSTGNEKDIPSEAIFYKTDICSEEFFRIFEQEKPNLVNHHAANIDVQSSINNPFFDAKINILGTINVLEACRKNGNIPIIYASSAAVYGMPKYLGIDENHPIDPISNYGISKFTPEKYIKIYHSLYGLPYTILRYSNVYGPKQNSKGEGGVISVIFNSIIENQPFTLFGDGEQTRDFIHVYDVINANLIASERLCIGVYNISTGKQISLLALIKVFEEVLHKKVNVIKEKERIGDIKHSFLINQKAKKFLNWEPTIDLKEGIKQIFLYYKEGHK